MIDAGLYEYIYLFVVTILTIHQYFKYNRYSWSRLSASSAQNNLFAIIIVFAITLFIGFRPVSKVFGDTVVYDSYYQYVFGDPFVFDWGATDITFENLIAYFASQRIEIGYFFALIAFIYFGGMFIACRKMFPRDAAYALLIILGAFSTFSYGVNGIRAGAAASLFLIAIAYRDNKWFSFLLLALSYSIHHSMQVLIVAYIIVSFIKNPKYYLWIWGASFAMAALHITFFQQLFAGFTDDKGAEYLVFSHDDDVLYLTGFRLDFIIYSAMPIILGYYLIFKRKLQSKQFNLIYNLYVLTNSVWLLCMYANFTNRIAYLSWQLLPVVLIYPFFNEKLYPQQYKHANYIALAHLAFTLFMTLIYH